MMLFKACPRCHGDMLREDLPGEIEFVCLQCGHRTYPAAELVPAGTAVRVTKKAA